MFKHLDYSRGWDDYWADHPEGYSPQEQMINWAGQLNAMIDALNVYFGVDLSKFTEEILQSWYDTGKLATIINESIFDGKASKEELQAAITSMQTQVTDAIAPVNTRIDTLTAGEVKILPSGLDDTTALQQAISSGKKVILEKGASYRLSTQLSLPSNFVMDGQGAVITYLGSGAALHALKKDNISIQNLTLKHLAQGSTATHGVIMSRCTRVTFINVHITQFQYGNGFFLTGCEKVKIDKCSVIDNGKQYAQGGAVLLGYNEGFSSKDITITNSEFSNTGLTNAYHGIYISALKTGTNPGNVKILGNTMIGNKGSAIQMNEVSGNVVIADNYMDGNQGHGMALVNPYDVLIVNNILKNSGSVGNPDTLTCGIYFSMSAGFDPKNVRIDGNIIDGVLKSSVSGALAYGVVLGKHTQFTNNVLRNIAGIGVIATSDDGKATINISGNKITDIAEHGIELRGGSANPLQNLIITNNLIANCGKTKTWSSGVFIDYVFDCVIANNVFNDFQAVKTMHNAINQGSGTNKFLVIESNAIANLTSGILAKEQGLEIGRYGFPEVWAAAPTVGLWKKGDIVLNQNPTAGGYTGWICIAGDGTTVGTWKGFGLIQA